MIWTESSNASRVVKPGRAPSIATINNLIRTIMSQKKNATEEHWRRASEHMVLLMMLMVFMKMKKEKDGEENEKEKEKEDRMLREEHLTAPT